MADIAGFNAAEVPEQSFAPLPDGEYTARIIESERQATKLGDGAFIKLKIEIIEGDYAGRTLFDRLNLWNKNPQAVDIAQQTLASICRAVGNLAPRDTQELHNQPLIVRIKAVRRKDNGEWSNEVKRYMACTGGPLAPEPVAPQPPPAQRLATAQGQTRPAWMKS